MKKLLIYLLIVSMVTGTLSITGCASPEIKDVKEENQEFAWTFSNDLVDLDTEMTEDALDVILSMDSPELLIGASPFYHSKAYEIGWTDTEYYALRQALITDLIAESETAIEDATQLLTIIDVVQATTFEAYEGANQLDDLGDYDEILQRDYSKFMTAEAILLEKTDLFSTFSEGDYERSMDQYIYVMSAYELQSIALDHLARLIADMEFLLSRYGSSDNIAMKTSIAKLLNTLDEDDDTGLLVESLLNYSIFALDSLRAIEDGDNYMALASLNITQEVAGEVLKNRNAILNHQHIDEETKELTVLAAEFYQSLATDYEEILIETMETDDIAWEDYEPETIWYEAFTSVVYADSDRLAKAKKYIDNAKQKMTLSKKEKIEEPKSFWGLTKIIFKKLPEITTKAIGDTIARVQNKAEEVVERHYMKEYGANKKQIDRAMKEKNDKFQQARREGKQYGKAYKKVYSKFEDIENLGGHITKGIIGDNVLSKSIAGVSKFFTGMVTGLGKGVVKMMNPESKAGDYFEASVDITLSLAPALDIFGKIGGATVKALRSGTASIGKTLAPKVIRVLNAAKSKMSSFVPIIEKGINKLNKVDVVSKAVNYTKASFNKAKTIFVGAKDKFNKVFASDGKPGILTKIKDKVVKSLNDKDSLLRKFVSDDAESLLGGFFGGYVWNDVKAIAKGETKKTESSPLQVFVSETAEQYVVEKAKAEAENKDQEDQTQAEQSDDSSTNLDSSEDQVQTDEDAAVDEKTTEEATLEETNAGETAKVDEKADSKGNQSTVESSEQDTQTNQSTSNDASSFAGHYSGYLTSANVGGMSFTVSDANTSAGLEVFENGQASLKVSITGTGALDMNASFTGKVTEISGDQITIHFLDDEGDSEILKGRLSGSTLTGTVDLIVDGNHIGTLGMTSSYSK